MVIIKELNLIPDVKKPRPVQDVYKNNGEPVKYLIGDKKLEEVKK